MCSLPTEIGEKRATSSKGPGGSPGMPTIPAMGTTPRSKGRTTGRILVLDDDRAAGRMLASILEAGGHEVARAESAQDGWRQLHAWRPELLVLDLVLPDEPGLDLLKRLKCDPTLSATPVVVITGVEGSHGQALAAGADAYLLKPVEAEELLVEARTLLETARVHRGLLQRTTRRVGEQDGRWVQFIAHDQRNLIGVVQANADAACESLARGQPAEAVAALADIKSAAEGLARLAEQLVEPERFGGATAAAASQPILACRQDLVSLQTLAREALAEVGTAARQKRVSLDGDASVYGDGDLLRRVFLNLIHNALKHGGGALAISIELEGEMVLVRVRDEGLGPNADLMQRVRTPAPILAARATRGHGLGLAFCKAVVEAHGGKFGVEAATGGGARFWFTVPVSRSGT